MEPKVYTSYTKRTLKDGTVRQYESKRIYIPKTAEGEKRTRPKKEGSAASVFYELKELSPEEIEEIRTHVRLIKSRRGQFNTNQEVKENKDELPNIH